METTKKQTALAAFDNWLLKTQSDLDPNSCPNHIFDLYLQAEVIRDALGLERNNGNEIMSETPIFEIDQMMIDLVFEYKKTIDDINNLNKEISKFSPDNDFPARLCPTMGGIELLTISLIDAYFKKHFELEDLASYVLYDGGDRIIIGNESYAVQDKKEFERMICNARNQTV